MTVETKTGPDGKPMVVVAAANEDSPLAFLLQPGDAILAVDGVRIGSPGEFGKALAGKKAGDTVKLLVRRNDLEIELSMPFGEP
jgi:S1-C subfamily serine protease